MATRKSTIEQRVRAIAQIIDEAPVLKYQSIHCIYQQSGMRPRDFDEAFGHLVASGGYELGSGGSVRKGEHCYASSVYAPVQRFIMRLS